MVFAFRARCVVFGSDDKLEAMTSWKLFPLVKLRPLEVASWNLSWGMQPFFVSFVQKGRVVFGQKKTLLLLLLSMFVSDRIDHLI